MVNDLVILGKYSIYLLFFSLISLHYTWWLFRQLFHMVYAEASGNTVYLYYATTIVENFMCMRDLENIGNGS